MSGCWCNRGLGYNCTLRLHKDTADNKLSYLPCLLSEPVQVYIFLFPIYSFKLILHVVLLSSPSHPILFTWTISHLPFSHHLVNMPFSQDLSLENLQFPELLTRVYLFLISWQENLSFFFLRCMAQINYHFEHLVKYTIVRKQKIK